MQQDFNKRMKILVRDIKKETQATIKNALKEARLKLNEGSEFVMNDVLNSIVSTVESAEKAVTGTKEPKAGKKIKEVLHIEDDEKEEEAPAPATPAKSTARKVGTRTAAPKPGTNKAAPAAKKPAVSRARIVKLTPNEPATTIDTTDSTQE